MNSKGHLILSLIKSVIRIVGCFVGAYTGNFPLGFMILAFAEALGVTEELVDKR